MHRVKSWFLTKDAWLLFEEWGEVKQYHRVFLWFNEQEQLVRISRASACLLLAEQMVHRNG